MLTAKEKKAKESTQEETFKREATATATLPTVAT
jgi:hypothetical protein